MSKILNEKVLREEEIKLVDAYIDKNGKLWIKETYPSSEGGMHYIASKELKLIRLVSDFAKKLIDEEKAILIPKNEWEAFKNSIK